MSDAQWINSRGVVERVVITGQLILETPAHFGNGDSGSFTDISLSRDPLSGAPLLTGTSIAGALRNYLREHEVGFGVVEGQDGKLFAEQLFGFSDMYQTQKASVQSWLMIDDALGIQVGVELRDGVTINPKTRTAEDKKKYDVELLAAGTTFPLRFELWLTSTAQKDMWLAALITALKGLGDGEIGLGSRKRRGYGQCRVEQWRTRRYSMTDANAQGLLDWLNNVDNGVSGLPSDELGKGQRMQNELKITATFALESSLLIRSGTGQGNAPDMVHLRSRRGKEEKPIVPGTSLGGVIRGRALRIANKIHDANMGIPLVDAMFGRRIESVKDIPSGSKFLVKETEIVGGTFNLVQNRVKIDRFTGGAYPSGLFSQAPVWSDKQKGATVKIVMSLRRLSDESRDEFEAQAGLLLLVLKDLWSGDLPLGGESSVGRGRLQGVSATIQYGDKTWELKGVTAEEISGTGTRDDLEGFVGKLKSWTYKSASEKQGGGV